MVYNDYDSKHRFILRMPMSEFGLDRYRFIEEIPVTK